VCECVHVCVVCVFQVCVYVCEDACEDVCVNDDYTVTHSPTVIVYTEFA